MIAAKSETLKVYWFFCYRPVSKHHFFHRPSGAIPTRDERPTPSTRAAYTNCCCRMLEKMCVIWNAYTTASCTTHFPSTHPPCTSVAVDVDPKQITKKLKLDDSSADGIPIKSADGDRKAPVSSVFPT